jgi:hypothetical protein
MTAPVENQKMGLTPDILHKIDNVSEVFKAPRLAPETYPGDHPETTCSLLVGDTLYGLRWNQQSSLFLNHGDFDPVLDTPTGPQPLDELLRNTYNLPTLAERYPLTVFGSNRNPGQLIDKFRRKDTGDTDTKISPQLEVVPTFMGTLKGYDAVYNAKPGNLGYFFADLYQGPQTADTEIEVAVLFLTKEQLEVVHKTEKAYDFKLLGEVQLGRTLLEDNGGTSMAVPAFAHVGKATAYAERQGDESPQPVALAEVYARNRGLSALGQVEFQDHFFTNDPAGKKQKAFAHVSGNKNIAGNSSNYVTHMKMGRAGGIHDLAERKEFQALLIEAMRPEEKMTIDPDQFETVNVNLETDHIPRLGDIAVLNFISSATKT